MFVRKVDPLARDQICHSPAIHNPLIIKPPDPPRKSPVKAKQKSKARRSKKSKQARQCKARQGKERCTDGKARVRMLCHDSEPKTNEIDRDSYTSAHESMPKKHEIDKESYTRTHESRPRKNNEIDKKAYTEAHDSPYRIPLVKA